MLQDEASWAQTRAAGTVTAYRQGGARHRERARGHRRAGHRARRHVSARPRQGAFGAAYGGEQSARHTLDGGNLMLLYPPTATSSAAPQPAPPALPVVPVPPNDLDGAELSVTTDAAEDSAPQAVVVPAEAAPVGDR